MNPLKTVLFPIAGIALCALTGCQSRPVVVEHAGAARPAVVAEQPEVPVEQRGVPPNPNSVWVSGHWVHTGQMQWVNGHRISHAYGESTYLPGHWTKRSDQWAYYPGHWQ